MTPVAQRIVIIAEDAFKQAMSPMPTAQSAAPIVVSSFAPILSERCPLMGERTMMRRGEKAKISPAMPGSKPKAFSRYRGMIIETVALQMKSKKPQIRLTVSILFLKIDMSISGMD